MGFSTIGTGTGGGGGGSAQQVNFSVTASTSQTISALYIANSIVDVAGLLVAVQNTSGSAITLTAASGSIVNTASYPVNSTGTTVVIQPNATVVLETNLANLNYFINSYSNITNILGGTAGQLVWQSAANTTGFIPTGAASYMLQSNGTSVPTWVPIAVPNVQGGTAGQVLYQAATNLTNFVTPGTAGQFLVSNGTAAPSWATLAAGQGVTLTNVGTTTTIKTTRSYTLTCSSQTSGVNINAWLTASGIPDSDGNEYTINNNTASNFTVGLNNIQNPNAWVQNGYFTSGASLILYPGQTATIQTYTAGTTYTIESTSQTQSVGFAAQVSSQGALPATTDTTMNFDSISDPWGAFNNGTHTYVIPKKGVWLFQAQNSFAATATAYTANIQILKNGSSQSLGYIANTGATASTSTTMTTFCAINCDIGDQIKVTNWVSVASIGLNVGNNTSFNGFLAK